LADLESSDDDDSTDSEGTAKQQKVTQAQGPRDERRDSPDWRNSLSQSRLSSLFDGWLGNPPATSTKHTHINFSSEHVNVSEPKLVELHTRSSFGDGDSEDNVMEEPDYEEFEQMLVRLSISVLSKLWPIALFRMYWG